MRTSRIKQKLARNEPAFCTQLHFTDASIFELVSLMGFDGIWMDLEHHGYSVETAGQLMRAARIGLSDIVARPAKGEFMRIGRLLELGAQAIMYPRCENAEEAAQVVRWSKFPPLGSRGFDGGGADMPYLSMKMADYIEQANRETLVIVQLEDEPSVAQAEAIAAVPGVDVLMLGPADFSIAEGIPGQFDHPKLASAVDRIAKAAHSTGKHWARPVADHADAQRALEQGARLIFHLSDIVMIKQGFERIQSQFGQLGFTFENRLSGDQAPG